jgi:hypothetical protein
MILRLKAFMNRVWLYLKEISTHQEEGQPSFVATKGEENGDSHETTIH